jgi:hypothetical protein
MDLIGIITGQGAVPTTSRGVGCGMSLTVFCDGMGLIGIITGESAVPATS